MYVCVRPTEIGIGRRFKKVGNHEIAELLEIDVKKKAVATIVILVPFTLTACGPSQEDIDNTATITCNIMGESRNMDAAFRIKEINAAREKIGEAPYLGDDDGIKESYQWGMCEELVKNDDSTYQNLLDAVIEARLEPARIASEMAAKQRLAEEKIAEQKRQEQAAEERRVLNERLEVVIAEYGWDCPISKKELERFWEKSWEEGDTDLYQAASHCHRMKPAGN